MTHIIAIEGIDGAGKNTLMRRLAHQLELAGYTTDSVSFPVYGTEYADKAHQILTSGDTNDMISPVIMAMLFAMDRYSNKHILDTDKDFLIVDRYVASNAAYTVARTHDTRYSEWIEFMECADGGIPIPSLTVLVDVDTETSRQRVSSRAQDVANDRVVDAYESDDSLQNRVRAEYHVLAQQGFCSPWVIVDNVNDTPEDNTAKIMDVIADILH